MKLEDYMTPDYHKAVAADSRLQALETVVRLSAGQCQGCAWEQFIKPLALPLVGFSRNVPRRAKEQEDWSFGSGSTGEEIMAMEFPAAPAPESELEAWMRTSEAYESVTWVWSRFLNDAETVRGCGLRFPDSTHPQEADAA